MYYKRTILSPIVIINDCRSTRTLSGSCRALIQCIQDADIAHHAVPRSSHSGHVHLPNCAWSRLALKKEKKENRKATATVQHIQNEDGY